MKRVSFTSRSCLLTCMLFGGLKSFGDETYKWAELPDFDNIRAERGARDDFVDSCGMNGAVGSDDLTVSYLEKGNWVAAESAARSRLETCPVDIRFHRYLALALLELGRESESKVHSAWVKGLVESVLKSGDGQSVGSAFVTISIAEEYDVLSVLRLRPSGQSLIDGRDRFEVIDEDGAGHVIFFFPELHWARLAKMFPN